MKLLVLANPGARLGAEELREGVESLRGCGHAVEVIETSDVRRAARDRASGFERVIACGGDGTISAAAAGLLESGAEAALVIAPAGTGNDLALSVGAGDSAARALREAAGGSVVRIDVGVAGDRVFVNAASAGPWAEVSADVPAGRKALLGALSYLASGLARLRELRPFHGCVSSDGFSVEDDFLYVAVANGPTVGGGMPIAAGARLDDGELDLVCVPSMPASELVGALRALWLGAQHEGIGRIRGTRFKLESPEPLTVTCDGEPLQARSIDFGIHPGALAVVVHGPSPGLSLRNPVDEAWILP